MLNSHVSCSVTVCSALVLSELLRENVDKLGRRHVHKSHVGLDVLCIVFLCDTAEGATLLHSHHWMTIDIGAAEVGGIFCLDPLATKFFHDLMRKYGNSR